MLHVRLDLEVEHRIHLEVKDGSASTIDAIVNDALRAYFYTKDAGFCANGPKAPRGATSQARLREHYREIALTGDEINSERWREIPGCPGYKISDLGRVQSPRGKILKSQVQTGGYRQVFVKKKDGKGRNITVHRVVAELFLPNPHNKPEVNHKQGNKGDCRLCMLEWATREENNRHAEKIGLRSGRRSNAFKKEVRAITFNSETDIEE